MYVRTATGLSPEITYFNLNEGVKEDLIIKVRFWQKWILELVYWKLPQISYHSSSSLFTF